MDTMKVTYKIVARDARTSAQTALELEQWKVDHAHAERAAFVNDLYHRCLKLFEGLNLLEDVARRENGEQEWLSSRARRYVFKITLLVFTVVRRLCESCEIDKYDHDASCRRVDQLISMTKMLRVGHRLYDPKTDAAALEAFKRGEGTTVDGLRQRLRDRSP